MSDAKARIIIGAEDQTRTAFASVQGNLKSMQQSVAQIRNIGAVVFGNEIVQGLGNGAKSILQARIEVEKLNNVLGQAVGVGRVAQELSFIRDAASRLGLEFQSTAASYAKFAAASRGTALEGQATRDIFTGIAQASTALGLSSDETAGALLAVQQIISKGKVSAEELRGQLGERLPGAFQIAARSIGVTTQELDRLLVSGSLVADDFLPKFGRQLELEFAESAARAANSTQASFNKMETAFGDLKRTLGEGLGGDLLKRSIDAATDSVRELGRATREVEENSKSFLGNLIELARLIPNVGLRALSAVGQGRVNAAGNADAISVSNDAILARQAAERAGRPTADTVPNLRRAENAITEAARKDLEPLLQRFRSAEQVRQEQINTLRTLGGAAGVDVSGAIAELNSRGARTGTGGRSRADAEAQRNAETLARTRAEVAGVDPGFDEDLRRRFQLYEAGEITLDKYRETVARLIETQTEIGRRNKEEIEDRAALDDLIVESGQKEAERIEALRKGFADLVDPAQQYRDRLAEIKQLVEDGDLGADLASQATAIYQRRLEELAGMGREVKATDDATKQLGLTFESAFEDAILNGKKFSDVLKGVAQDLARVALRQTVTQPLFGGLLRLLGGSGSGIPRLANDLAGFNALPFADGGIMTSRGSVPLRRYAGGGIARSPQLAMFGEGSMAEAYVPLPDGRSIPVTMSGTAGTTLVVNVDARGSADVESVVRRAAAQGAQQAQALMFDRMNRTGAMA